MRYNILTLNAIVDRQGIVYNYLHLYLSRYQQGRFRIESTPLASSDQQDILRILVNILESRNQLCIVHTRFCKSKGQILHYMVNILSHRSKSYLSHMLM